MIKQYHPYAAINNNEAVRMASSSGGVFTLIAEDVLAKGGAVFGAGWDPDMHLTHICVEQAEDLAKLRGSKYVRSQLGDSYAKAKEMLDAGRPVLFSGTPCQLAGLRNYLDQDYPHLISQDIICHGAPMPQVWEKYLRFREAKAGAKATAVSFRDKSTGWSNYSVRMDFQNGATYRCTAKKDPYMRAFLQDLTLCDSCYLCKWKNRLRLTDITLADFWGIQQTLPQMDDDKGTSLVFANTPKGMALLESLQDRLTLMEADTKVALDNNLAMVRSASKPADRAAFLQELNESNFQTLTDKFRPQPSFWQKLKRKAKGLLGKSR